LFTGDANTSDRANDALPWLLSQGYTIVSVTGAGGASSLGNNGTAFLVVLQRG
jgi:hypothetical protein